MYELMCACVCECNLMSDGSDQKVFEWDQTLEEVNIYINLPPNVPPKQFYCKIQPKHVEVGIKGNPPYLNVWFFSQYISAVLIMIFQ